MPASSRRGAAWQLYAAMASIEKRWNASAHSPRKPGPRRSLTSPAQSRRSRRTKLATASANASLGSGTTTSRRERAMRSGGLFRLRRATAPAALISGQDRRRPATFRRQFRHAARKIESDPAPPDLNDEAAGGFLGVRTIASRPRFHYHDVGFVLGLLSPSRRNAAWSFDERSRRVY